MLVRFCDRCNIVIATTETYYQLTTQVSSQYPSGVAILRVDLCNVCHEKLKDFLTEHGNRIKPMPPTPESNYKYVGVETGRITSQQLQDNISEFLKAAQDFQPDSPAGETKENKT